jgi:hypothetical protein
MVCHEFALINYFCTHINPVLFAKKENLVPVKPCSNTDGHVACANDAWCVRTGEGFEPRLIPGLIEGRIKWCISKKLKAASSGVYLKKILLQLISTPLRIGFMGPFYLTA